MKISTTLYIVLVIALSALIMPSVAGAQKGSVADTPTLSKAYATAHAVSAIEQATDLYQFRLIMDCKRNTFRSFDCDVRWYSLNYRVYFSGTVKVWLQYRKSADRVFWHYRVNAKSEKKVIGKTIRYRVK